ncbi:MAG TPA: hypothetical protein VHG91_06170 [Longimicrobium sp.]|nr:hypothetical protein [Longimicrobium sp.]
MSDPHTHAPEDPEALEIEPLSEEALETVAGGATQSGTGPGTSDGPDCCSLHECSWQC